MHRLKVTVMADASDVVAAAVAPLRCQAGNSSLEVGSRRNEGRKATASADASPACITIT